MAQDLKFQAVPETAVPIELIFGLENVFVPPTEQTVTLCGTLPVFGGVVPFTAPRVQFIAATGTLPAFGGTVLFSVPADQTVSLNGALPALGGTVTIAIGVGVAISGVLPRFSGTVNAIYDSQTERPMVGQVASNYQIAVRAETGIEQLQQHALATDTGFAGWFSNAQRAATEVVNSPFTEADRVATVVLQKQQDGVTAGLSMSSKAQHGVMAVGPELLGSFQEGARAWATCNHLFQDGLKTPRVYLHARWSEALHRGGRYRGHAGPAMPRSRYWRAFFEEAWVPRPGIHVAPVLPITPIPYWGGQLLFACPPLAAPLLVFGLRQCEITPVDVVIVPVRRVYFVINDVSLHRVIDGVEVPVFSLSLSLDAASWAWGFEATLPAIAGALVDPGNGAGPVALLASVNGADFHVFAESISRERTFGDATIKITGRGRNAVLAAPYAPVMTFSNTEARTTRQLMDDVLTLNGITLGWTVDWGLTDWNVPSGVFAHQGTWIEALSSIAGAAGGYLIPHRSAQSIRVRHRYPVAPWEWDTVTPDFVLPVDAVQRESLRWLEKPSYNRVFVSGQEIGVLGQVTRAGTAGDVLAPMVVDSLITEAAAARQRGIAVLSDTGRQIEVTLRLPVLAETGIIEPGAFVEYQDGSQGQTIRRLGLVRATQVQAGLPEVWQTLGVQAYA